MLIGFLHNETLHPQYKLYKTSLDRILGAKDSRGYDLGLSHLSEVYDPEKLELLTAAVTLLKEKPPKRKEYDAAVSSFGKLTQSETAAISAFAFSSLGYARFLFAPPLEKLASVTPEEQRDPLDDFECALAKDINCSDAHLGNSLILLERGFLYEALICIRAADALLPHNNIILNTKANIYLQMGNREKAYAIWTSIKYSPNRNSAHAYEYAFFDRLHARNSAYLFPELGKGASRPLPGQVTTSSTNKTVKATDARAIRAKNRARESLRAEYKLISTPPKLSPSTPRQPSPPTQPKPQADYKRAYARPKKSHQGHGIDTWQLLATSARKVIEDEKQKSAAYTARTTAEILPAAQSLVEQFRSDPPDVELEAKLEQKLIEKIEREMALRSQSLAADLDRLQQTATAVSREVTKLRQEMKELPVLASTPIDATDQSPKNLQSILQDLQEFLRLNQRQQQLLRQEQTILCDPDPRIKKFYQLLRSRLTTFMVGIMAISSKKVPINDEGTAEGVADFLAKGSDVFSFGAGSWLKQKFVDRYKTKKADELSARLFHSFEDCDALSKALACEITMSWSSQIKTLKLDQNEIDADEQIEAEFKQEFQGEIDQVLASELPPEILTEEKEGQGQSPKNKKLWDRFKAWCSDKGNKASEKAKQIYGTLKAKAINLFRKITFTKPPKDGAEAFAKAFAERLTDAFGQIEGRGHTAETVMELIRLAVSSNEQVYKHIATAEVQVAGEAVADIKSDKECNDLRLIKGPGIIVKKSDGTEECYVADAKEPVTKDSCGHLFATYGFRYGTQHEAETRKLVRMEAPVLAATTLAADSLAVVRSPVHAHAVSPALMTLARPLEQKDTNASALMPGNYRPIISSTDRVSTLENELAELRATVAMLMSERSKSSTAVAPAERVLALPNLVAS